MFSLYGLLQQKTTDCFIVHAFCRLIGKSLRIFAEALHRIIVSALYFLSLCLEICLVDIPCGGNDRIKVRVVSFPAEKIIGHLA